MIRNCVKFLYFIYQKILYIWFPIIFETSKTNAPIYLKNLISYQFFKYKNKVYWPIHKTSFISYPERIEIGIGTAPGLSPNCYIQGMGGIKIGDYTIVAPGVGIISANHNLYNISLHDEKEVTIGKHCWIGMNAVILPGVKLGDHTIVAAGSIVTKSFEEGYSVVAGIPAKTIKKLDKSKVERIKNKFEYVGYYKKEVFYKKIDSILDSRYK
jgi:acetyltransferase-like isoleucine patch superfamily enzyme